MSYCLQSCRVIDYYYIIFFYNFFLCYYWATDFSWVMLKAWTHQSNWEALRTWQQNQRKKQRSSPHEYIKSGPAANSNSGNQLERRGIMELELLVSFMVEVCIMWNLYLMFLNFGIFHMYGHRCKASCMWSSVVFVLTPTHVLCCAWFYTLSCVGSGVLLTEPKWVGFLSETGDRVQSTKCYF